MIKYAIHLLPCFILFQLLSNYTYAFTLSNSAGAAFDSDDVYVDVEATPCQHIGMSNEDLLGLAQEAVDQYWNRAPTSRLRLHKGSIQNLGTKFRTEAACTTNVEGNCTVNEDLLVEHNILIACNENSTGDSPNFPTGSNNILALTVSNNISGKVIHGALFLINDTANNSFRSLNHDKKKAVLAHEIGHAIGLGHSRVKESLMYYQVLSARERLGWDDIDGITYLYPADQPVNLGCGTISKNNNPNYSNTMLLGLLIGVFLSVILFQLQRFSRK